MKNLSYKYEYVSEVLPIVVVVVQQIAGNGISYFVDHKWQVEEYFREEIRSIRFVDMVTQEVVDIAVVWKLRVFEGPVLLSAALKITVQKLAVKVLNTE